MSAIRNILYIASALIAASVILVFVPWSTLNAFLAWFGPFAFPDDPLVQYTVKVMMLIFFWLGVLMAVHGAVWRLTDDRHRLRLDRLVA